MTRPTSLLAALAAVLVVAVWWLFLYSPGQEELARVEDEIAAAENERLSLQQRVAQLEAVRARAPETEAAIATLGSFVPDDPALPPALRQVQAAAEDAGATITAIAMGRPVVVDEPTGLHAAQVTLSVDGSYFQIVDMLRRIENPEITSRGIVFGTLTLAPSDYPTLTATIAGSMYAVLDPVPEPPDPAAEPAPDADGDGAEPEDGTSPAPTDGGTP